MLRKILLVSVFLFSLVGCQETKPNRAEMESSSRSLTHKIIVTESTFNEPLIALMPEGISRMSQDELEKTYLTTPNETVSSDTFQKVTNVDELIVLVGQPVRKEVVNNKYIVLSYNGSNHSYVAFVFSIRQNFLKVVGYKSVHPW